MLVYVYNQGLMLKFVGEKKQQNKQDVEKGIQK